RLNMEIQTIRYSNKNVPCASDYNNKRWYLGDIVVMKKNSYTIGVMNGDEGYITSVQPSHISVMFYRFIGMKDAEGNDLKPVDFMLHYKNEQSSEDEEEEEEEDDRPIILTDLLNL